MANEPQLAEFAERLIRQVRDEAIIACDRLAAGEVRGPLGNRWREVSEKGGAEALVELIPDIVDQVLFHLLDAIDNGELQVGLRQSDGSFGSLEELGQGEMGGWIMAGKGGWIERYSDQRFVDPLAALP